jgi:hypothetical protein
MTENDSSAFTVLTFEGQPGDPGNHSFWNHVTSCTFKKKSIGEYPLVKLL